MILPDLREPVSAWTHAAGLALAVPATLLLWRRGRGDPAKRFCLLVFGLGLVTCYTASTLFHSIRGPTDRVAAFARLDLIGIYTLIAGSYTPLAWVLLRGCWRWGTLATAWLVAASATALISCGIVPPTAVSTGLFLAAGWGVLVCLSEIARVVSPRGLSPLVGGGLLYSTGAVINLLGWPVLWPGTFAAHELFHLFVLAGSAAHYRFMLAVVAPFPAKAGVDGRSRSASPHSSRE